MLPALALLVQQVPPPLPDWMRGDWMPGPWVVFVGARGGMPPEAATILEAAQDATERAPTAQLRLCPEGAPVSARQARRNLALVRGALLRAVVPPGRIGGGRCDSPAYTARPAAVRIEVRAPDAP